MNVLLAIISLMSLLFSETLWAASNPKFDISSKESHQIQLLEDGTAALEARLQLIEQAEKFIVLETFIYDIDEAGSWIARALVEKKKQNPDIKIRILIDSVPFRKTVDSFIDKEFRKYGIEVKLYNQYTGMSLAKLTVRNHRKIMASEKDVITGSRNIANDYFNMATVNNFIDRDIWIRGPVNSEIMDTFEAFWESEHSTQIQSVSFPNMNDYRDEYNRTSYESSVPSIHDSGSDVYKYEMAVSDYERNTTKADVFVNKSKMSDIGFDHLDRMRQAGKRSLQIQPVFEINDIRFVSDGPDWVKPAETITGSVMLEAISQTKQSLMFENGYIIPDTDSWATFKKLMTDGKQIFILTNSRKASRREFVVNALTLIHAKNFAAQGAKVYLYSGGPMPSDENPLSNITEKSRYNTHAKSYVIDRKSCMIGTANFDPRSLRRMNAELAVMVDDPAFCQHLERMILLRSANGHFMDKNGEIPPDIDVNDVENVQQRLLLLMTPLVRLFERWF